MEQGKLRQATASVLTGLEQHLTASQLMGPQAMAN